MKKIVFIPGNGGCTTGDNWFPSVQKELEEAGLKVIAATFPDPELARESFWIPYLLNELKVDEETVLIGHSSGAIAAMRLAEQQKILGSVLVGAYHTDLGIESEKQSGYFNRPWDWEKIKANQEWTVLFASDDDPWIPIEEPAFIRDKLQCEYHEFTDQGHFGGDYFKGEFPEVSRAVIRNLRLAVNN